MYQIASRRIISIALFAGAVWPALAPPARAVDLLQENFDELPLGPVQTFQSEVRSRAAFTHNLPASHGTETWSVDNSLMPAQAISDPLIGVVEFEGWSFVDRDWWVNTADDQGRSGFVSASGTIAVADPDEWDDFGSPSPTSLGHFDSTMRISNVDLKGIGPNTGEVFFHSSWRFEGIQKASLVATYNDPASTSVTLLQWDSDKTSPNFKGDATNEAVTLPMQNPAGATRATLEFRLYDAGNNWWWGIDNLKMFTGAAPAQDGVLRLVIDRDTRQVKIVNNTGATVNLRGYTVQSADGTLDESLATFLSGPTGSANGWQRLNNPTLSEFSEGNLSSYAMPSVNANPTLGQIVFGNAWRDFYQDISDVSFQYLVTGSDKPVAGIVEFTGNGGQSFNFLDLNYDGQITIADYAAFLAGYHASLTGLTAAQQHNLGDLDGDGKHTISDFLEFKRRFDQLRGPGAFAAALAVPEPASGWLFGVALVVGVALVGGKRRFAPTLLAVPLLFCGWATQRAAASLPLLVENFDEIPLGASPKEDPTQLNVWNGTGPTGWTVDRSGVPGVPDPNNDGVTDWAGWAFASNKFWGVTTDNQERQEFTRGSGTVMVADGDEWDDAAHPNTSYMNTFVTTPVINIPAGIPAGKIKLNFDSSWRPEGFDDWVLPGQTGSTNNQTATINVRYNGGAYQNVLTWDSDGPTTGTPTRDPGPHFHDANTNEAVEVELNYNGTATTLQLQFGYTQAANDWWWAVDNVRVIVPAAPTILQVNTTTGTAKLVGGDVINESIKGYDVTSANGDLAPSGNVGLSFTKPDSVDGPDPDSTVGNNINETWQLGAASSAQFSEFFLDGQSGFTSARSESLGHIFNAATLEANRDLQFTYTTIFGDIVTGVVQYVSSPLTSDFNSDGRVDGADFLIWQRGKGTGTTHAQGDADGNGVVNSADLVLWKSEFGAGSAVGAMHPVPEPTGVALAISLATCIVAYRRSHRGRGLAHAFSPYVMSTAAVVASLGGIASAVTIPPPTLDRNYRLGDGDPGAANGTNVGVTRDDAGLPMMNQLIDLTARTKSGTIAKYETVTGRPDGGSGLGVRLNPNPTDRQYLATALDEALNFPEASPSSTQGTLPGGTIDYSFVTDRGFQLWVKPSGTGAGHIVMDSNNHGVLVDATGKFDMRYSGFDYPSSASVTPNTWYHLAVVRAFGPNSGSVLYVNGIAVAAAAGAYLGEDVPNDEIAPANQDDSPLVVGARTAESSLQVGGGDYFHGLVDDLKMFVMGLNASKDYGEFQFDRDDDYAAFFKPTTPGDLDGNHIVNMADVTIFASHWLTENQLKWTQNGQPQSLVVGDLSTRMIGDFNYDGRVNLSDWQILNAANPAMAAAAMALIGRVPEPATCCLAATALVGVASVHRRRATGRRRARPVR